MKYLFYVTLFLLLLSCAEKTEENSKYSNYILGLNEINSSLDSSYSILSGVDQDYLKKIMNTASLKHANVKKAYKSDTIDSNYEVIMLTTRGAIYKRLKKYFIESEAANEEYEFASKQYNTLKKNLIHEKLNEEKAFSYTNEEKNSMILLNGKINTLNNIADESFSIHKKLFFQLDSIIETHEND